MKEEYISLKEAAKYCSYSQDYLKLRARQGKLKAVKIGRNWVTTKDWLQDYVDGIESSVGPNLISIKLLVILILIISIVVSFFYYLPSSEYLTSVFKGYFGWLNSQFSSMSWEKFIPARVIEINQ